MLSKKNRGDGRRNGRSQVTPFTIDGEMHLDGGRRTSAITVWNISDDGFCIWSPSKVRNGERVNLSVMRPYAMVVSCVVRWCRAVPEGTGFLLGLEAAAGLDELAHLHQTLASRTQAS